MRAKWMFVPAVCAAAGLMYAGTSMSKADGNQTTETNLVAHLSINTDAVSPSADGNPATLKATYTVTNPTDHTITYQQAGLAVDWKVMDDENAVVCDVNKGKLSPHLIAMRVLGPNEHADYKTTVTLQDDNGEALHAGHYMLQAHLLTMKSLQASQGFRVK